MLEDQGVLRTYKDGDLIFREGDYGKEMYVIKSGRVKIFRSGQGREVQLAVLDPGEFFGEIAVLDNRRRSANAVASMNTELIAIDRDTFRGFITQDVVWDVLSRMTARMREIDDKLEDLMVEDQVRKEHISSLLTQRRTY